MAVYFYKKNHLIKLSGGKQYASFQPTNYIDVI